MATRKRNAAKKTAAKKTEKKPARRYYAVACDSLLKATDESLTYTGAYSGYDSGEIRVFASETDAVKYETEQSSGDTDHEFVVYEVIPVARHKVEASTKRTAI